MLTTWSIHHRHSKQLRPHSSSCSPHALPPSLGCPESIDPFTGPLDCEGGEQLMCSLHHTDDVSLIRWFTPLQHSWHVRVKGSFWVFRVEGVHATWIVTVRIVVSKVLEETKHTVHRSSLFLSSILSCSITASLLHSCVGSEPLPELIHLVFTSSVLTTKKKPQPNWTTSGCNRTVSCGCGS